MSTKTANVLARIEPDIKKKADEMDSTLFNEMMQRGLEEAKADCSQPIADVFAKLKQEI